MRGSKGSGCNDPNVGGVEEMQQEEASVLQKWLRFERRVEARPRRSVAGDAQALTPSAGTVSCQHSLIVMPAAASR
jgi:hypothetical protein